MNETITVIVPVYNVEKFLNRCVDSILSQTYTNLEIYLIDDGSIDNSGKICDDYAKIDKRVHVIHKKNGGASSARNIGLNSSTGSLVAFVDSDDYLPNDAYDNLLSNMTDDIDLVLGNMFFVGGGKDTAVPQKLFCNNFDDIFDLIENNIFSTSCNKLYRRSLITNLFDEKMTFGEDLLFNLNYFKNCYKIKTIEDKVYYRYNNPSSVVHTFSEKAFYNQANAVEQVRGYFKNCNLSKEQNDRIDNFAACCILPVFTLLFSSNLPRKEKKKYFDKFRQDEAFLSLNDAKKSKKNAIIYFLIQHKMFGTLQFLYKLRGRK